jgi:hypothetical protein
MKHSESSPKNTAGDTEKNEEESADFRAYWKTQSDPNATPEEKQRAEDEYFRKWPVDPDEFKFGIIR